MKIEIHNNHLMAEAKVVMEASVILRPEINSLELINSPELARKEKLPCDPVALASCDFIVRLLLHSQGLLRLALTSDRLYVVLLFKMCSFEFICMGISKQTQSSSTLASLTRANLSSHPKRRSPITAVYCTPWCSCPTAYMRAGRAQSTARADCSSSVDGKNKPHLTSVVVMKLSRY